MAERYCPGIAADFRQVAKPLFRKTMLFQLDRVKIQFRPWAGSESSAAIQINRPCRWDTARTVHGASGIFGYLWVHWKAGYTGKPPEQERLSHDWCERDENPQLERIGLWNFLWSNSLDQIRNSDNRSRARSLVIVVELGTGALASLYAAYRPTGRRSKCTCSKTMPVRKLSDLGSAIFVVLVSIAFSIAFAATSRAPLRRRASRCLYSIRLAGTSNRGAITRRQFVLSWSASPLGRSTFRNTHWSQLGQAKPKPKRRSLSTLHALYSNRQPDLIISIGAPAAAFVQRHRTMLFPNAPMVLTVVDQRRVQYSALGPNDTVVAVAIDYRAAVENILKILPDTNHMAGVVGSSPIEAFWRDEIEKEASRSKIASSSHGTIRYRSKKS